MDNKPTVVVPWDFSQHAEAALNYAIEKYSSDNVRVICVLEQPHAYEMGWGGEEAEQKAIESCIAHFFENTEHAHDTGLQFFTEFGDPSDEIVRFAKEQNAGVIVIPTHGRTGLRKLFMGSVAQKVIGKASCPVVVLPLKWVNARGDMSIATDSKKSNAV